jgi:hypothetical protein
MSALLIAYAITGIILWAGMIMEFIVNGHVWRLRDTYGLPVTMIGVTILWPIGIANWQIKEWKKGASNGRYRPD